jgi:hypothetical protein
MFTQDLPLPDGEVFEVPCGYAAGSGTGSLDCSHPDAVPLSLVISGNCAISGSPRVRCPIVATINPILAI